MLQVLKAQLLVVFEMAGHDDHLRLLAQSILSVR